MNHVLLTSFLPRQLRCRIRTKSKRSKNDQPDALFVCYLKFAKFRYKYDMAAKRHKEHQKKAKRFVLNSVLLAQPQTFVLHQLLRHLSIYEFWRELLIYYLGSDCLRQQAQIIPLTSPSANRRRWSLYR